MTRFKLNEIIIYNVMTVRSKFYSSIAKTSPFPLGFEVISSKGSHLFDVEGKTYLDFISGIGVSNLGHSHPEIIKAIHNQADQYLHTMVYGEHIQSPQVLLADLLLSKLPSRLDQVYFLSSGTEAIETALKLARKNTGRPNILACKNAYHGSTYGALSLMSDPSKTQPYQPILPGIGHITFNDIHDLDQINSSVAAVVLEMIQGEAGIYVPEQEWLTALMNLCKKHQVLIILDEIQSAMGRTGKLFAMEHFDFQPDILVLGKSLGGGLPLSACIAHHDLFSSLADDPPLTHMSTFGGHPLSCAAGLAALTVLTETDIVTQSNLKANRFKNLLIHPSIKEVRHPGGLWMAVDLDDASLVQQLIPKVQEQGLLLDWFLFNDRSIRIAPPLNISDEDLDLAAQILLNALDMITVSHAVTMP